MEVCGQQVDFWRKNSLPPLGSDPETMVGTYTLDHFIINLYIESGSGGYTGVGRIDSSEFESFSGTLDLQESTISATVTIEEETETVSGPYTHTAGEGEGVFHVVDGTESHDLHYNVVTWSDPDPPGGMLIDCGDPALTCFLALQSGGLVCEMTTL